MTYRTTFDKVFVMLAKNLNELAQSFDDRIFNNASLKQKRPKAKSFKSLIFYWSGQQDSNLRPHAPQACTLPGCAMPRTALLIE